MSGVSGEKEKHRSRSESHSLCHREKKHLSAAHTMFPLCDSAVSLRMSKRETHDPFASNASFSHDSIQKVFLFKCIFSFHSRV